MSLRLSIRLPDLIKQLGSHCADFHKIWYFSIFGKSVGEIQVSLNSHKNSGHFIWRLCTFMMISCWVLLRIENISRNVVDKIKTHVFNRFFPKMMSFMGNVVVRLTTDNHLIWGVVLCILDNEGYRHTHTHTHTHKICITCFFSRATIGPTTHFIFTLYVHCFRLHCCVEKQLIGWRTE
jgi:hypothetical protein